jgi:PAS domain S-box-containing protein
VSKYEAVLASDPRACLLVSVEGIVQSANAAARHILPTIEQGSNLISQSASPDDVSAYLRLCARTRGPIPGKIGLNAEDGLTSLWICHGGLVDHASSYNALIVLRLQDTKFGKAAFEKLNQKINALNSEIAWKSRAELASAHLAAIVATSTDAIYSKDLNKTVTSWNLGAERMFGYSAKEIIGKSVLCLIPAEKLDEEKMILERLIAGESLKSVETLRQTREGCLLEVSITPSAIRDRSGRTIGFSQIVRDITARKNNERSLVAAHSTFEKLINNSPFGIFAVDADFRITLVSAGAHKAFANVHPLIGRDLAEALRIIWPEPEASEFIGHFRETLETGHTYHSPNTVLSRRDTAELEAYDWKVERLTLPDGRLGIVCHYYDLSERQLLEAALRESEKRFRGTFENASVGIAHVGLQGEWLDFNDRLCELLGYSRTELLDRSLKCLQHPDDQAASAELLGQLLAGKLPHFQCEERYFRKDGSIVWVGVSVGLQSGNESDFSFLIYVVRDITSLKAAQDHQTFLMGELAHRSKNQLAVINAMARQTARNASSLDDFSVLFERRLKGLAVSIDLLVTGKWSGVGLGELIDRQLEPFKGDQGRLRCEGPVVLLNNTAAEAIGLALHELATNCLKYGAWSVPAGIVEVTWNFETANDTPVLRLNWVERGGPHVSKPTHRGFGHNVIEKLVAQKLNAKVDLAYLSDGVTWTLLLPSNQLIT